MNESEIIEKLKSYMQDNNITYLRKSQLADFAIKNNYEIEDINNIVLNSCNVSSFRENINGTCYTRFIIASNISSDEITARTGLVKCNYCGYYHNPSNDIVITVNGTERHYCSEKCINYDGYYKCTKCGEYKKINYTNSDGIALCKDCCKKHKEEFELEKCDKCGNYYKKNFVYKVGKKIYCKHCTSYLNIINDYHRSNKSWSPKKVHREKPIYFGFENEIENKGETPTNVIVLGMQQLLEELELKDFYKYEHDGSLTKGFEAITEPFTLAWLYETEPKLQHVYDYLKACNCSGERTNTTGLHIHVSRDIMKKDYTLAKVMFMMHNLQHDFVRFSLRNVAQLGYCNFFAPNGDGVYTLDYFKNKYENTSRSAHYEHTEVVNREHAFTIEIRLFKGTIDLKRIIANIELVNALFDYAEKHNDAQVESVTFKDLCLYKKTKYLKPLYYKTFEPKVKIKEVA